MNVAFRKRLAYILQGLPILIDTKTWHDYYIANLQEVDVRPINIYIRVWHIEKHFCYNVSMFFKHLSHLVRLIRISITEVCHQDSVSAAIFYETIGMSIDISFFIAWL